MNFQYMSIFVCVSKVFIVCHGNMYNVFIKANFLKIFLTLNISNVNVSKTHTIYLDYFINYIQL